MRRAGVLLVSGVVLVVLWRLIAPWTDAVTPLGCRLAGGDCRHPLDARPVYALAALCLVGAVAAIWAAVSALRAPEGSARPVAVAGVAFVTLAAATVFSQTVRMDYSAWKTVVGVNVFEDE